MYKMYKCLKNKTGKGFYFKEKEKKIGLARTLWERETG